MSGIATFARIYSDKVRHTKAKIIDTRKTVPCLRLLDKYAVTMGGCENHRTGLFDMFLIKDNHIEDILFSTLDLDKIHYANY